MAKTIQQTTRFSVPPDVLFDIYLDSKKHSAATNSKASVSRRVGGKFSAFHGMLQGRNLAIIPKRMIVQSWRGSDWKQPDLDSILILTFSKAPGGGQVNLVHANIPDHASPGIRRGWPKYYWKPWRTYLKKKSANA
jgi:activator of HSP90 ATPase